MRIFVTGGTGLLGNTILRQLSDRGDRLWSLVRGTPPEHVFAGIQTEFVTGDLLDHQAIDQAVSQCDAVIHCAGLIHIGWQRLDESLRVNQLGTRVVAEACVKHRRRLVHVGTVDTLAPGAPADPADEETPLETRGGKTPCSYVLSKRAGVEEVLAAVKRGLDAVIVHPGFMLGPWDWKPSSGRMMREVGRSWKPLAPPGGCSVCDSRDVAAATIAAVSLPGAPHRSGRQYILAGHNVRYLELWTEMAQRMGARPPLTTAGPAVLWLAGAAGDLWAKLAGEGDLNSAGTRMSRLFHFYDSTRAERELGYQIRPLSESLDAAADWIKTLGD